MANSQESTQQLQHQRRPNFTDEEIFVIIFAVEKESHSCWENSTGLFMGLFTCTTMMQFYTAPLLPHSFHIL